jgi:hypothetical protein
MKKAIIDVDNGNSDNSTDSDDGTTMEPATEPVSDHYEALKAMVDADNKVCSPLFPFQMASTFTFLFRL